MVNGVSVLAAEEQRPSLVSRAAGTFGANLAVAALSFLNVILTARALGPSGRGEVAFLTAVAMLSANFALFGIGEANANIAGAEPQRRGALFSNSLVFAGVFGLLAIACVASLVAIFPGVGGHSVSWLRWVALAAIPMLVLQTYLQLLMQASYRFMVTNIAWVLGPVVNVVANATLLAAGHLTVASVVVVWVVGQGLGTTLLLVDRLRAPGGVGRLDVPLGRRALAFGLKSHPGRVMMVGNYRLDQWILGAVSGTRELGLYSVAVAWAETLFYLPTSLVMAQRPDLVRASGDEARSQTARSFRAALWLTAALALLLFLLAPVVVTGLFGSRFRGAVVDLRILTAGALGVVALKVFSAALTAQRRPLLSSAGISIALVATVVLDVALIPPFGDRGAAIASTIAYSAGGVGIAAMFVRALGGGARALVPRGSDVVALWQESTRLLRRRPHRT